ncbi:MAG: hypothetical protein Ct9H90mP15_03440 [Candidatus Neomarinimicrobiota bacterium]|nr:MAG: hypothetical protein Ct9H90mP15_03440 [Candidatus Neomarinimicrobiota bacterium]
MFTNSIDRLEELVGNSNIEWADDLISITKDPKEAMNRFKKIALQV